MSLRRSRAERAITEFPVVNEPEEWEAQPNVHIHHFSRDERTFRALPRNVYAGSGLNGGQLHVTST